MLFAINKWLNGEKSNMTDEQPPSISEIKRIFLMDLSFETPMGQAVFDREWRPEFKVRLDLRSRSLAENLWEVVLTATVTATLETDVAFLIEAQQVGVFEVVGQNLEPKRRLLAIDAPKLVFPYLRETVDSVATKGGFPAVGLQPPDFETWYADARQPETPSGTGRSLLHFSLFL